MSFLRGMFSGQARGDDPRRFLIEAMLGAMGADGDVLQEELTVFEGTLASHDLFRGLSGEELSRLTDLAADAIRDAGGGRARLPEIARRLPSRSQRLAAYTMAAEICVADNELAEAEIDFLDDMQTHFGLADAEAKELFEAARKHSGLLTLDEKSAKMRDLLPQFVRCMALMAASDGEIRHEERLGIRAVLQAIPDMNVLTVDELDEALAVALDAVTGVDVVAELATIATIITDATDRYWTTVYMMIVALADGKTDWREVACLDAVKASFRLDDLQMDTAMDTAAKFPKAPLGGRIPRT